MFVDGLKIFIPDSDFYFPINFPQKNDNAAFGGIVTCAEMKGRLIPVPVFPRRFLSFY